MKAALYLRVSTDRQDTANQEPDLHAYVTARGWTLTRAYVDAGISGSTERRPQLDQLLQDARRRRFDVVIVWRLDRLGRNLRHLITTIEELHAVGVQFVSLGEGIDATTPAGRLQLHVLAALAQFERDRIGERVRAAHARLRAAGKHLGRPKHQVSDDDVRRTAHLTMRRAAEELGISAALVCRLRSERPRETDVENRPETGQPESMAALFRNR